jgi:predicted N-acyltransferase
MMAQTRIIDTMSAVSAPDWQKIAVGQPALRHEVLRALQTNANRAMALRIFLLEDEDGLAAAAIGEHVTAGDSHNPLDTTLFGRARGAARNLRLASAPALVFESALGSAPPILARKGPSRSMNVERLLSEIERYGARHNLSVAFSGIPASDGELASAFERRRYLSSEVASTAWLEVEWSDFDGYLQFLRRRSRNSAKTVRGERNRNARSGTRIRRLPATAPLDPIYVLAREHYRRKNRADLLDSPGFLPQLRQDIGEDLLCFAAERDGQRIASVAVVRFGDVGWVSWLGFAEHDRPNDFTYSNLAYYHLAESAAQLGINTLLYGNSVLKAKEMRGCKILINRLYWRPRSSLARTLFRPYMSLHRAWYRRKMR